MKFLPFIWHNLLRNPRRTLLTMLSLAVFLFLYSTLMSVMAMMDRMLRGGNAVPVLTVHRKTAISDPMPLAYQERIAKVPGVKVVCPFQWYGGVGKDETFFFQTLGVDPETVFQVFPEFSAGTAVDAAFKNERTAALLAANVAHKLDVKPGDRLKLRGTVWPVDLEFTVAGLLPPQGEAVHFIFHRQYLDEAIGRRGIVNMFWVLVERPDLMGPVARQIDGMFENSDAETWTESRHSMLERFLAQQGNIRALAATVAGLVLTVLLLVVANSLAMSMRERTGEIATLKAIGFSRGRILSMLLAESTLLAALGGAAGCLAAFFLFNTRGFAAGTGPLANIRVTADVMRAGLGLSALTGLASGLLPALRATRVSVVEAFRQVG